MTEKFTVGPWATSYRQRNDGVYSQEVYDTEGKTICSCSWYKVDGGIVEVEGKIFQSTKTNREHNAHLIAAAPEMYNEIKDDIRRLEGLTSLNDGSWEYEQGLIDLERKRKLLAKARGEG